MNKVKEKWIHSKWKYAVPFLVIMVMMVLPVNAKTGDIPINAAHFKSEALMYTLEDVQYDKNRDGVLSQEEIKNITKLVIENPWGKDFDSFQGIEYLTELKELDCRYIRANGIILDLSKNTKLEQVDCSNNKLTGIKLGQNRNLKKLICANTEIVRLDLQGCPNLEDLDTSYCDKLKHLNVTKNTKLKTLNCYLNIRLTSLNIRNNKELVTLICDGGEYQLDVTQNKKLETLSCDGLRMKKLNVTQNKNLKYLSCRSSRLEKLDVTKNKNLQELYCNENQLKKLDVTKNKKLKRLDCTKNQITSLNLKNNLKLQICRVDKRVKVKHALVRKKTKIDEVNVGKTKIRIYIEPVVPASAYQVQYSTKKNFKNAKTVIKNIPIVELKKLKAGTYYIKTRYVMRNSAGKTIYGKYSNVIEIKVGS